MAKIDVSKLRTNRPSGDEVYDNDMYKQYAREPLESRPIPKRKYDAQEVEIRREEGMLYKLRRLMYGKDVVPDIAQMARGRISQRGMAKAKRISDFYKRIESVVN